MDLGVPQTRSFSWWMIVYASFISFVDASKIGLVNSGGPDLIKWVLRMPVWFLPIMILAPRWGTLFQVFRRPPTSWLLAWSVTGLLSAAWAIAPSQAILIGLSSASLTLLGTWYVYTQGWYRFATAVSVGLTLLIGTGMLLDFSRSELFDGRSSGLTFSPTTQGRLAAICIVMAAGVLWTRRSSQFLWLAPVIAFPALALSETRTAMAATAVGLLYGGLRRLSTLNRGLVIGALVIGTMSAALIATAFSDVGSLSERGDPTTVAGRTEIWPVAVDLILEKPILGYGWGAEEKLFDQAARSGSLDFIAGTSHSIALTSLLQGGVVAFGLLGTAILSIVRHRKRVDAWIIAPVYTLLLGGLTEAIVQIPGIGHLILGGCAAAIARTPRWGSIPGGRHQSYTAASRPETASSRSS